MLPWIKVFACMWCLSFPPNCALVGCRAAASSPLLRAPQEAAVLLPVDQKFAFVKYLRSYWSVKCWTWRLNIVSNRCGSHIHCIQNLFFQWKRWNLTLSITWTHFVNTTFWVVLLKFLCDGQRARFFGFLFKSKVFDKCENARCHYQFTCVVLTGSSRKRPMWTVNYQHELKHKVENL